MDTKKLRQKILDLAIRGKLVPQDSNDEPASVLLERIKAEKEQLIKEGKIKRSKQSASSDTFPYENIPFEIPDSWAWTTIGDCCEVVTGTTPSKDICDYYGGGIPFYKPTDLEQGINIVAAIDSLTAKGLEQCRKLPQNSILVTCIGATIGKTGIIRTAGACNQQINALIPYKDIHYAFLYYVCISNYLQTAILENSSSTTLPIINKGKFSELLLPLPSQNEQQRIINAIKQWFHIIDQIEREKTDLEMVVKQTKSKILDLAIHGKLVPQDSNDEPAIELLRRINPDFQPCDNAHYKNLPRSWAVTQVSQISKLLSGRDIPNNLCNEIGRGIPYIIGASNIVDNNLEITRWTEMPQVIAEKNDVLISCKGTIGQIIKNDIDRVHIARQFMAIRPNAECIDPGYLLLCVFAIVEEIKKDARGVVPGISRDDILLKQIPLPPINEQQRIYNVIRLYNNILDSIIAEL